MIEVDLTDRIIDSVEIEKTIKLKKEISVCKNNPRYCHSLCTHFNYTYCELFE